ncbi:MAG: 4-hydroxybenzoate polyprenyltransferase [Planctomycetota bacterium]|nr:MAG: 4-hydroxybenzoate polyprenyltransferase [Planctomycetota bacterium]
MVWLALLRPANCLTAAADAAAGWAVAGAHGFGPLALVAWASACLYAGGIALNDVCDARRDARHRPERPIPSGAISRRAALALAGALLIAGLALALAAGSAAGLIAAGLVVTIVLYDAVLKRWAIAGAVSMGACRGLNLLLGVSLAPAALAVWWPAGLGHVVFIGGITFMARRESGRSSNRSRRRGVETAGLTAAAVCITWFALALARPELAPVPMIVGLGAFGAWVAPGLAHAWRTPDGSTVRSAVSRGVIGIVLLDAALAASAAGWAYGLAIAALAPIAVWLGRRHTVT